MWGRPRSAAYCEVIWPLAGCWGYHALSSPEQEKSWSTQRMLVGLNIQCLRRQTMICHCAWEEGSVIATKLLISGCSMIQIINRFHDFLCQFFACFSSSGLQKAQSLVRERLAVQLLTIGSSLAFLFPL